jgi:hypothetical protein
MGRIGNYCIIIILRQGWVAFRSKHEIKMFKKSSDVSD